MRPQTILVTGGAGYIGSHVSKALYLAGYQPVVYDNLIYGHRWAVKWGPLIEGELSDKVKLGEVLKRYTPEAVVHLAAFAYVGESLQEPSKYYNNNVMGSLALLDSMKQHGVSKVVFSSTCATYGIPDRLPICENTAQSPINPYGASKLMVERIMNDYDAAYDIQSVKLRYFNAAGADPEAEIGESHSPETHLIPLALMAASGKIEELQVFGNDYSTEDGTCIRDYTHVSDLAWAHVLALKYLETKGQSTAVNLGTGKGYSVHEVLRSVEKVTGKRVPYRVMVRRPGDPPALVSDATRASMLLGWHPRFTSLDEMVAHAWKWHSLKIKEKHSGSASGLMPGQISTS